MMTQHGWILAPLTLLGAYVAVCELYDTITRWFTHTTHKRNTP